VLKQLWEELHSCLPAESIDISLKIRQIDQKISIENIFKKFKQLRLLFFGPDDFFTEPMPVTPNSVPNSTKSNPATVWTAVWKRFGVGG
jgi:hypothetical protein